MIGLEGLGLVGTQKTEDHLGVVERKWTPETFGSCVFAYFLPSGAVGPSSVPVLQGGPGQSQHTGV